MAAVEPEARDGFGKALAAHAKATQLATEFEVWPDNWRAFELFYTLRTQWRSDFGGRSGLDYGPLFTRMDRMQLSDDEYDELFYDIQTMENAVLNAKQSG